MKDPNEENKKIKKLQNLSMNVFIQQIVLFGSVYCKRPVNNNNMALNHTYMKCSYKKLNSNLKMIYFFSKTDKTKTKYKASQTGNTIIIT